MKQQTTSAEKITPQPVGGVAPKYALLELTERCNLNCAHCYASRDAKDLPTEKWIKIFDILKDEFKIKNVILLGGEPTLRIDFFDLLQYAIGTFDGVTVETNGQTATKFGNYDCTVSISIEYADEKKNDEVRGEGTFSNAIRKLQVLKNPKILRYTIWSDSDPLEMALLAERVGANSVGISFKPVGAGNKLKHKVPQTKQLKNWYKEIMIFDENTKFNHIIDDPQYYIMNPNLYMKHRKVFLERKSICSAAIYRVFINAKGIVTPCPFISDNMGNILKNANQILNKLTAWRNNINNQQPIGKCAVCTYYNICNGGCVACWNNKKTSVNCPLII